MAQDLVLKFGGLTAEAVLLAKKQFGVNSLPAERKHTIWLVFGSQFKSPLVYVILMAAVISLLTREYINAVIILIVVLINALAGFFQEYKTQKIYEALRALLKPTAEVVRDGVRKFIDVAELVPGDVVILTSGDRVPADGEVLETAALGLNEAILTGESEVIFKDTEKDKDVFMGTVVMTGRGVIRVTKTGLMTELGKITATLKTTKDAPTQMQIQLKKFSLKFSYVVLALAVVIFIISFFKFRLFFWSLNLAAVLAVAAIPEGLMIAVTVILVLGMQRILKRRGLVKRLLAVETLGTVTVICTDKTGTLTEGNMRVTQTDFREQSKAILAMTLCNNLEDSLEVAFWKFVQSHDGFDRKINHHKKYPRLSEEPFSGETKLMLTVNQVDGEMLTFAKGAPEVILDMCRLESAEVLEIQNKVDAWAEDGLKIIALAYKQSSEVKSRKDFVWLGLVAVEDPLRPEIKEALALCHSSGIEVKIITGDHPATALAVAKKLGLAKEAKELVIGTELEKWSVEKLQARIGGLKIFARIAPHQKMGIVKALQTQGEIVAMIGDGVNDALAIKQANIGIATGEVSDVAKEAASLILLDSNFRTIVAAVEEGRGIYENIKKVVIYTLSNSFDALATIFFALILGWPAPLTIIQILWINLICDGPVDLVLGFEPREKEAMTETPKFYQKGLMGKRESFFVFIITLISAGSSLIYFWYYAVAGQDEILGRTMVFTNMTVISLIYIFSLRSLRHVFWRAASLWRNKYLIFAVGLGLAMQVAVIYLPALNRIFGVKPLDLYHWFLTLLPSFAVIIAIETIKYFSAQGGENKQLNKLLEI